MDTMHLICRFDNSPLWGKRARMATRSEIHPPPGRTRAEGEGAAVIDRKWYYMLVLLLTGLAISHSQADVEHCRFISVPKDRLACFDKETEPVQISKDPSAGDRDKEKWESPSTILKRENDLLTKRMGTICRGC
jgi:hypothetical protein